jgi:hypothetical protein
VKRIFHFEKRAVKDIVQPLLCIEIGNRHCLFAIIDFVTKEVGTLNYYVSDKINETAFSELISNHTELSGTFYQVYICYSYSNSEIIPQKHFNNPHAGTILKMLYGNWEEVIISESLPEWQVYNIYGVPAEVIQWLQSKFPFAKYWHQHTLSIKSSIAGQTGNSLLIDFRTEELYISAFQNNKLILAQNYSYSNPADVLYYLLQICEHYNFSQRDVKLHLSGLIEKESALYKELYQYFLNIEFRPACAGFICEEYPPHFFTSLNDLAQCVS